MRLSVILTCHNRKEKTLECLDHLYSQEYQGRNTTEVFLVDDGSTDGTGDAVKDQFPNVHVIKGNGTLFWNRGMLLAWQHALAESSCSAVVWLNDDTMLLPNAVDTLVNCASRHEDSIIVGSTISDSGKISYGGYMTKGVRLEPQDSELECRIFNGNIVMIPRSVSDKIGLLDKRFSHSMGDFEYGRRAVKNNIHCFVTPAIGICNRNSEYVRWRDKKYSVKERLQILYSPLGTNPFEAFYYFKEESFFLACKVFIYLHCSALFPSLFHNNNSI